jgi:hypothetical protein
MTNYDDSIGGVSSILKYLDDTNASGSPILYKSNFRRHKNKSKYFGSSSAQKRFAGLGVKNSVKRKLDFVNADVYSRGKSKSIKICQA